MSGDGRGDCNFTGKVLRERNYGVAVERIGAIHTPPSREPATWKRRRGPGPYITARLLVGHEVIPHNGLLIIR